MRHGKLKVVTCVTMNGTLASGGMPPALTCACAAGDTRNSNSVARANVLIRISFPEFPP